MPKCNNMLVPVCQKAFLQILGIKKGRLLLVNKKFFVDGCSPHDRRGGDRKSHKNIEKRKNIIDFIISLKCTESHYCRSRTVCQYLSPELSISKLIKLYNHQAPDHLKVKSWLFHQVFNRNFNLGFKSPKTDKCSTCI